MSASALRQCEWFAMCANPANYLVPHPALGEVPTCRRCALRLGEEVASLDSVAELSAWLLDPAHANSFGQVSAWHAHLPARGAITVWIGPDEPPREDWTRTFLTSTQLLEHLEQTRAQEAPAE